ncbi:MULTISPECIES: DUF1614 domain-containing protein [unclassified Acidocella]|uniref:DUF1614 domain-containing protein n=1 Tax=unclassified Acidocella TaxID=2648610 RepID=UPI00143B7BE0|nr:MULTISPECIES: DUF1614 domain-containing protein [unclassified Acidocella]WBO59437.1 DUF1614 domain-containing protein [Acidocella sp. MX-AZ03]
MILLMWFSFSLAILLLVLMPLAFTEIMMSGLAKLHLSADAASLLVLFMLFGGAINIPILRFHSGRRICVQPLVSHGVFGFHSGFTKATNETVVAVNLGGCVIPVGLALFEFTRLMAADSGSFWAVVGVSSINIFICYDLARIVPGIGITLPGLMPAFAAAGLALVFLPQEATPIAFIAGVAGPLIGADLLHLPQLRKLPVGMLSIGGAGTFDGIVLAGIIAAYLA